MEEDLNIFNQKIKNCSCKPVTGFYRNGKCSTGPEDQGLHTVCVEVTQEFLSFSKSKGNDLSTPHPEWGFPGLKPGDRWCLCALRWKEAFDAGKAPLVFLESTHKKTLDVINLSDLEKHAVEADIIPFQPKVKDDATTRWGE